MTSSEIIKLRLFNQQIVGKKFAKPQELVSWMGAVQAQDYGMAKWAIGLRVPGTDDTIIEKAFNEGKILRTHVLRPTWHFVTPQDIRWMLELTAPRILSSLAHNDRHLSLDKKVLKKTNDVLAKALEGGKQLTRDEVRSVLQKARIDTSELRFIHLLEHAELDRVICSGERKNKLFTYALFDERASAKTMGRDEALAELTKRFFISRGPATIHDFAWWSGLSLGDAKKGIEMEKRKFKREVIDGKEYFFRIPASFNDAIPQAAWLLPNYDEYVISYKDRTESINRKYLAVILKQRNAVFTNAILINGKIEGLWERSIRKNSVFVTTKSFSPISKARQKLVIRAVNRYSKFLAKALEV